jgi:Protein of unknown function DUF2625
MMPAWLQEILAAPKTSSQPCAPPAQLLSPDGTPTLPDGHVALLRESNGLLLYDGYFRILGLGGSVCGDLRDWNVAETWKFAWPQDLSGYLCFAETAWGDQYAYEVDRLRAGEERVVFLDALRMKPRILSGTFSEFAERYLVRNAVEPYDSVLRAARDELGALPPGVHLVFSPPTILTGEERVDQIVKVEAREAMILNGDLWTQLGDAPEGAAVAGLEAFVDDAGRQRMRVVWV